MTQRAGPRGNLRLVVFWVAGALLAFSAMAVSLRALSPWLGVFEMLALRNGSGIVILLLLALARPGLRPQLAMGTPGLQIGRNLVHFVGTYTWSYAVTILPFALVFALEFTNPIWVTLMAVPFSRRTADAEPHRRRHPRLHRHPRHHAAMDRDN